MKPTLYSRLAAAALAGAMFLAAGAAIAQPVAGQKKPVVMIQTTQGGVASTAAIEKAKQKQARFDKLCTFGPVMSDAAIEGCKQAHKL